MRVGSAAIARGSAGRMNAGSTIDRGLARVGEGRTPGEGIVALELPRQLEAGEREGRSASSQTACSSAGAEDVVAVVGASSGTSRTTAWRRISSSLDVVRREAPVALRLQVAERERAVAAPLAAPARGRRPSATGTAGRGGATRG